MEDFHRDRRAAWQRPFPYNGRSMSYTVLARKYRPQQFADVIGQEHVTRTLKNAIAQGRIAHGYIFSGHRGIGKTTVARILAMALNCRSGDRPVAEPCGNCESCREIREGSVGAMDVIEIDAATNRGIEEVRGLIATATAEPARDRYRIFILDEAHQVTDAAFNALLKTLEEPPPWVVFMLATTQPEDIPQTIRSRCQHFSFHAVRFADIMQQLRAIATAEGLEVEDDALALLAEAGDGSMRDALSIMDQAIACCGTRLTHDDIRGLIGTVPSEVLENILRAVAENSADGVLRQLDKLLVEGQSPVAFARQMVRFLRNCVVARVAGTDTSLLQISQDEKARVQRISEAFGEEDLSRLLQIMLRTHNEVSYRQEQRFHLELGLLKMVHAQRLLPLEQLLSQAKLEAVSAKAHPPATPRSAPPVSSPGTLRPKARTSPLEADRSRKVTPPASADDKPQMAIPPRQEPVSSVATGSSRMQPVEMGTAVTVPSVAAIAEELPVSLDAVRSAVIAHLQHEGQQVLVDSIEASTWRVSGAQLMVPSSMGAKSLELVLTPDLRRQLSSAASQAAGRRLWVLIESSAEPVAAAAPKADQGDVRERALEEPVVKRMQEKFGAEVRSIVEPRE